MKIAVNTRFLLDKKLEGIGWFTYETVKRIVEQHPEHTFYFIFDREYHEKFIFSDNVTPVVLFPPARHPILWYWWFEHSITKALSKIKPDIFLSTDGFLSLRTDIKQVAVIHDLGFEHFPDKFKWSEKRYLLYFFRRFAKKAERIITVSEFTKKDISERYHIHSDLIDVVYNGSNAVYKPLTDEQRTEAKIKFASGHDYFIYIGALAPRKNVARLLEAFDAFKESIASSTKMLIVGAKLFHTQDIENTYKKLKYKDDVIFTGHLPGSEMGLALGGAVALAYVSYFEGFGIPIVEAFYAGVPVITSNVTSMPEVAGDAALLVDPFSVKSIADAMSLIYSDQTLRKQLIEKGFARKQKFSWDKTAERVWQSIEKVLL